MFSRQRQIEEFQYEAIRDGIRILTSEYLDKYTEFDIDNVLCLAVSTSSSKEHLRKYYPVELINRVREFNEVR